MIKTGTEIPGGRRGEWAFITEQRYTVTTRMTPFRHELRMMGSDVSHFYCVVNCVGHSHETDSVHKPQFVKRKVSRRRESNRGLIYFLFSFRRCTESLEQCLITGRLFKSRFIIIIIIIITTSSALPPGQAGSRCCCCCCCCCC